MNSRKKNQLEDITGEIIDQYKIVISCYKKETNIKNNR
jgi:hypothetical protein